MRIAPLAALLVVLAAGAGAQGAPNLSGTWVLQADKSDFGMMPGPTSRTDVIDHQEPKLTIRRTVVTSDGQQNVTDFACAVDGRTCENVAGPLTLKSVLRWDGRTLVMATTTPTPQGEVAITDRYSLSEDGQTLTQARTLAMGTEQTTQTMVLARKP
jgi:hypothetical protein